ncbi:MAG: hypothetical protein K2I64_04680 [Muribaculaceae bacterium]|nr:hypothetical protein [Muribaculaceae bacterium]
MNTFYIFYNNSIFSLKTKEADSDPYSTYRLNIDFADGFIECRIPTTPIVGGVSDLKVGAFYIKPIIQGRIWHEYGFGEVWELILEIKNSNSESPYEKIKFKSGEFTNSFSLFSIGRSVIRALNELHRFESVQDCVDYQITKDDAKHEIEDDIVNLSKVITLCQKYQEINPVFPYQKNLREWIEKRINSIIQKSESNSTK